MERIETDILVAGGGVAGLAATAAFAAAGFRVACVDPAPPPAEITDPRSDLRSTAFLMPSVRLLEEAGLWRGLAPHAAPLRIMRIADAGGPEPEVRETADFIAQELGHPVFGYNLPNWLLRREMLATLESVPGAHVRLGASVTHLTPRTREAIARLSDGTQIRARLVVAADGRDSALRDMAGITARRWGYGQKAMVFAVSHEMPHEGISTEVHRSGGPFTLVPLPDRDGQPHSAVVWMEHGPRAAELAAMETAAFEEALNTRACGVLGRLTLASPRRTWPIISQVARRLDGSRLALIAEAAHVIPPIGAQGLNMSLKDIAVLRDLCTDALRTGQDIGSPERLRRYHWKREPDILARVAGVDTLNRAAMENLQSFRDLRLRGLRAIHGIQPIRRTAMQLGLGMGRQPAPAEE
ncbi:UbiH/UbiF family hydroxylase [Amaricoccus macauensis]|uniref:UbiH/UbiF family hydroxylase n=1 Tax=Amaricoccus macauensis TaxID=57001 RepID=UPI003C798DB5